MATVAIRADFVNSSMELGGGVSVSSSEIKDPQVHEGGRAGSKGHGISH
jgi:hypothetical protein